MKQLLTSAVLLFCSVFTFAQIEIPAKLTDRPELIIKHNGFTLSYNKDYGTPNWVAWVLTKNHVQNSSEPRSPLFFADPSVPISYRVVPSDYTNSGYDRGHMAPAADMSYSKETMKECFYMSNMCPQNPSLNRISWKALESKCRSWVMTEDTLYIVCGPVYKHPPYKQIGHSHKVTIPTGFFKVILSLKQGHEKSIGFYYSNSSAKHSVSATATTVDAIELLTGIDFFYTLDNSIEELLESKCNLKDWR